MALEDEPGIEFWADPRLLLRPRGLFVTSAADVMVAPSIASQVEDLFRQSRLLYSLLVADVQVLYSQILFLNCVFLIFGDNIFLKNGNHCVKGGDCQRESHHPIIRPQPIESKQQQQRKPSSHLGTISSTGWYVRIMLTSSFSLKK